MNRSGLNLTLTELLSHATVADLALHISSRKDATTRLPVTCLREAGAQAPLFLIHEVSGEVFYGPQLVPCLEPGFPVYGLTSYDPTEGSLRTLHGMAARLLGIIRGVQPTGPYRIVGYSFGGTLAYEVAVQLIGQDEQVEFLGLLDSGYSAGMESDPTEGSVDQNTQLTHFVRTPGQPAIALEEFDECAGAMDFDSLVRRGQELSLIPEYITAYDLRKYLARHAAHVKANEEYRGQPVSIPVHLFMAQENVPEVPLRGWDALLPREQISLIQVPGDHGTMLEKPNVEILGAALTEAMQRARGNETRQAQASYSPLIRIRAGQSGRAPLFCIPGGGDNVASFAELADSLGPVVPIYGLQPRGFDGTQLPHATVSAAAHAYLQSIQQLCPGNPIHLLGHSFGGWIAFEIASELQSRGRPVASLTLIDVDPPQRDGDPFMEYTRAEAIMEMVAVYEMMAARRIGISIEDVEALDTPAQLALLQERLVQADVLPPRKPGVLLGPLYTFETALRARYQPKGAYAGPIHLAVARRMHSSPADHEQEFAQSVCGWQLWAPHLSARRCPGNHITLLKYPHVQSLSEWLRPIVEKRS